jgi:predicted TIM-barrel fold metal-dependent hydrolase
MIIDNHVHVFPDQAGLVGYQDAETYSRILQRQVRGHWGRMVSSHTDSKYVPEPDENVGFTMGKYGRQHWRKHGEDCWLQRGPVVLADPEHTPEQMLAHMDFVGIDMGVIQAGYMEPNYGREVFFADCIKRWPDRFIGTAEIDYDLSKDDAHLEGEIRKLTRAVEELGYRGLFSHVPGDQQVDDPRCDPLWKEVVRLGIPVYLNTGIKPKQVPRAEYLEDIQRMENVLKKYPEMNALDAHIGFHIRHPRDPEYVDNPREFFSLLKLGNFFLEVGYVLAYENWAVWGREFEYPYPRHEQIIKTVYENFGAGVLVWGSDMPWAQRTCPYRQNLDLVRLHTDYMTDEERKLIMGGTLERLFKVAGP